MGQHVRNDGPHHTRGLASYAYDINDTGLVAGYSQIACDAANQVECDVHAFVGGISGLTDIGGEGGNRTVALAINSSGQVAGTSNVGGTGHAYIGQLGQPMVNLGTLGGTHSDGSDINDDGVVAGSSRIEEGSTVQHAYIGAAPGLLQDLGTLGGSSSLAKGVNNAGNVVGYAQVAGDAAYHAFLWDPTNGMMDLNDLVEDLTGWSYLLTGDGISDSGHIIGQGYDTNANQRFYLLTPISETGDPGALDPFGPGTLGQGWSIGVSQGTAEVVQSPVTTNADMVVKLTTGSPVSILQNINTPNIPFVLNLDYLFGTTTGVLNVFLDSILLASIQAPDLLLGGFTTFNLAVSDPNLLGLSAVPLETYFDGATGSVVYLDNIALTSSGVPTPGTLVLSLIGLAALRLARKHSCSGCSVYSCA